MKHRLGRNMVGYVLLIGATFYALSSTIVEDQRIRGYLSTEADVINVEKVYAGDIVAARNPRPTFKYKTTIRYRANGSVFTETPEGPGSDDNRVQNSKIRILYNPDDPTEFTLSNDYQFQILTVTALIIAEVIGIAIVEVCFALKKRKAK